MSPLSFWNLLPDGQWPTAIWHPVRKRHHVPIGFRYDPEASSNSLSGIDKFLPDSRPPVSGRRPEGPWRHQSFRITISGRNCAKRCGGSPNFGASAHFSTCPDRQDCPSAGLIRARCKNATVPMRQASARFPKSNRIRAAIPLPIQPSGRKTDGREAGPPGVSSAPGGRLIRRASSPAPGVALERGFLLPPPGRLAGRCCPLPTVAGGALFPNPTNR
jgi:hypothetical protein